MNDDEIIGKIKTALGGYNLGDIKYLLKGKKVIAGFVLSSCFIDHMVCFRYGSESTGKLYKQFVKEYLLAFGYEPEALYRDLRCKLVHNYTVGKISFDLGIDTPNLHLKKWNSPHIFLNLNSFVSDLESIYLKYERELKLNETIRELAIKRFKEVGVLQFAPLI